MHKNVKRQFVQCNIITEETNVVDAITAYNYLIGRGAPASSIVACGESLARRCGWQWKSRLRGEVDA
jgi:hypothetical protein